MEIVIVGLLTLIVVLIGIKKPSAVQEVLIDNALDKLDKNRDIIVQSVRETVTEYFPQDVKPELVELVVEEILDVALDVIKEGTK